VQDDYSLVKLVLTSVLMLDSVIQFWLQLLMLMEVGSWHRQRVRY